MLTQSDYTTRPDRIQYMPLPSGEADIWLRRNIAALPPDEETGAGGYTAEEAYMRTAADREEVEEHFDEWFARAAAWEFARPGQAPDTVADLQTENAKLRAQVEALTRSAQFLEDCIAEMAEAVYA